MRLFKYVLLTVLAGLCACQDQESEYLFDQLSEERMAQVVNNYTEALTAPEHGWIGYYTSVSNVGGFMVLLQFGEDGNVRIKNEAVDYANIASKEESVPWRVGIGQFPELVFESASIFSEWHGLRLDEGPFLQGGEFQFFIESATEEQVVLRSKTDEADVTYLRLRKANKIDWDLSGIDEFADKLSALSNSSLIIDRKLVGSGVEKYVEFDGRRRCMIVEGETGKAALYRFGLTRTRIVMLDTIYVDGKWITEFEYVDSHEPTIRSTQGELVEMKKVVETPEYIHPMFLEELVAQNANVLSGPSWIWVKNPELEKVEMLDVRMKSYKDYYGLEFLPNLKVLSVMGNMYTDSKIDLRKNKKLRRLTFMLNLCMTKDNIHYDGLEELEEVVFTANPLLEVIDLRTSSKSLKRVDAHMNDTTNFKMYLNGASRLTYVASQQNGWQELDITGCMALETLLLNSCSFGEKHENDKSESIMGDIIGLDAKAQKNLNRLFIPSSANCGTNVLKFYRDCKTEGRDLLMMYGHSLIKPETHPNNMYDENSCSHE